MITVQDVHLLSEDTSTGRRRFLATVGAGTAVGLAGCLGGIEETVGGQSTPEPIDPGSTTLFPQYKVDTAHSGVLGDRRGPADGARLQWSRSLSDEERPLSQPVVADGHLAVREDGTAYLLDLATGATQWETDAGRWDTSALAPPVFDDGTVFVPVSHGVKACDPADGTVRWEYGGGEPAGAFVVYDGTVLLAQSHSELVALDAADKTLRARLEPTFNTDSDLELGLAVSEDGTIAYPSPFSSTLVTFEYGSLGSQPNPGRTTLHSQAMTTPAMRGETAFLGFDIDSDADIGAVDTSNSALTYDIDLAPIDSFSVSPAVTEEYVIGGVGGTVLALDRPSTGTPRVQWTRTINEGVLAQPTVASDVVYIGAASIPGDEANLWTLDLDSGERRWATRVPGGVTAPPVVTENAIYVSTSDGRLHALAA